MHVVYQSFHGRFSDSPRALFERLCDRPGSRHTWLQDPAHAAAFPPDVATVSIHDRGVPKVLESADLLIAGTHTEFDWDKPPGTTYLQTWHGTPLKRIHYDVLLAPPGRLERLDRDVARWDALLSPNAVSTPRLRNAFGFEGEVWETGYPRNDLLLSPDAGRVRTQVRDQLGLGEEVTAVLYAPTWRDDEHFSSTSSVPLQVDVPSLARRLNDSGRPHHVLPRLHNMMTERSRPATGPGVTDVSYYRDVRELILAADVLVTDYSSVMFDFALTGKPIVFYAYDLHRFRNEIRGFYFDLLPQAPGPVLSTEDELVAAVLAPVSELHRQRYAAFRRTYGHLEDGHATDRVLTHLGLS
ncbi:MAG: CDP-glycerol glycerophosphotransferase [Nocardioidaceae bacterium]|jgi:CDP-glycerol glycerophosphotransferase|nr:CDP-glycerol glycerophosphotransferase [Nocardioidaceae bacterium]